MVGESQGATGCRERALGRDRDTWAPGLAPSPAVGSDTDPLPCGACFLIGTWARSCSLPTLGKQMRWGSAHSRCSGNVHSPLPHSKVGCMKMLSFLLFNTQRGLAICPRHSPGEGPGSCVPQMGWVSLGMGRVSSLGVPPGALHLWREVLTC